MKPSTILFSAAAICILLSTPGRAQDTGANLFQSHCQMCHGPNGSADTPTGKAFHVPNFHDPAIVKMSDAELTQVITHGKNKMPAFGTRLDPPQIQSLVHFIRALQKQ